MNFNAWLKDAKTRWAVVFEVEEEAMRIAWDSAVEAVLHCPETLQLTTHQCNLIREKLKSY
jgi:hypothetical protein